MPPTDPNPIDPTRLPPRDKKRTRKPKSAAVIQDLKLRRGNPPKPVVLPFTRPTSNAPTPIPYQTLALLVADLRRLLCTPHEDQPFYFRGAFALVADPAIDTTMRITHVAWALVRGTPLSFNPDALVLQAFPFTQMALTTVSTSTIWMTPLEPRLAAAAPPRPCTRCEHQLSVTAMSDDSRAAHGLAGQRVVVGLRHF